MFCSSICLLHSFLARRRFDATEVEDPNVVELPASVGGGSLLFFTGAWVSGDNALNCTDGDQPQPDSEKLADAQRIGVAYRCDALITGVQCECVPEGNSNRDLRSVCVAACKKCN